MNELSPLIILMMYQASSDERLMKAFLFSTVKMNIEMNFDYIFDLRIMIVKVIENDICYLSMVANQDANP